MSTSPQATFQRAQTAVERGDWRAFARLLRKREVRTLLKNSVTLAAELNDSTVRDLFNRAGFAMPEVGDPHTFGKRLVKAIDGVSDAAGLLGQLEQRLRDLGRGGSFSSSLFLGETLQGLAVDGTTASGTRMNADGTSLPIHFTKEKDSWKVGLQ